VTARTLTLSLFLLLAGCKASLGEVTSHPVQVPASKDLRLIQIQLPVSDSFIVTGGSAQAMEGIVTTNVPDLAPKVSESGNVRKFVQRLPSGRTLPDGAQNTWNLRLGPTTPILLDIGGGVLKGDMSLGGLSLVGLNLGVGVSAPKIHFDQPNRSDMKEITINAGAGECQITGLGNAQPQKLKIEGGAGTLDLDFSGTLRRTVQGEITGGVGAVTLTLPKSVPARLQVETGIGAVTAPGFAVSGQTYTSPGFAEDKPHWDLKLEVGVGAVAIQAR
jgi:hypothetical protein